MTETIDIHYLPGSPHLEMIEKGNWIDLYTYEDYTFEPGDFHLVNLGVSMRLPEGYEAHIAPRSSTFKRYGLIQTNGVGVVDFLFNGQEDLWMMPCYATRAVSIPRGTRLCQFRIVQSQPKIEFNEVEYLNGTARGGFGSTGV